MIDSTRAEIIRAHILGAIISCVIVVGGVALATRPAKAESCIASWYGSESGSRTASGELFNPAGMTAAHKSRPFGSYVTVTHLGTGRSVRVRINDRGPFIRGRCIDLSKGAARALGMGGTARVSVE